MADPNIYEELEDRENEAMQIQLSAAVQRTAITINEYVAMRELTGATRLEIERELLDDLNNGGRIFGEFRNAIKATAHGNIRRVSDIGNYTENGIEIEYVWVTVEDSRVCDDCSPRHMQTEKWSEWEVLGMPRTGWSVCRSNCRCFLAATDAPAELPRTPVKRQRKRK